MAFGLTRMLLGYAMESAREWQSVLPYDESSGLISLSWSGYLASLMQLDIWRAVWRRSDRWKSGCPFVATCSRFLPARCGHGSGTTLIEQQWQAIVAEGVAAEYGDAVPISLLRDELAQRLDQERIQRFPRRAPSIFVR